MAVRPLEYLHKLFSRGLLSHSSKFYLECHSNSILHLNQQMRKYFDYLWNILLTILSMKRLILFALIMVVSMVLNDVKAQTVGYTYKALSAEGCSMEYSVAKQNDKFYIIATVSSDRMKFLNESAMMVRTENGDVIKFSGELINNGTKSAGIVSGNMVIPITSVTSTAQFEVSPEQFELLKNGIIKIRLTTIPLEHEREFKTDKIGKKLYEFYLDAKNKDAQF